MDAGGCRQVYCIEAEEKRWHGLSLRRMSGVLAGAKLRLRYWRLCQLDRAEMSRGFGEQAGLLDDWGSSQPDGKNTS